MELIGKIIFGLFTIILFSYVRTIGKHDVHRARILAHVYMIIAMLLLFKG